MTEGPRLSRLQQDRSRRTRASLVASAERLWLAQGFDETPVMAICEDAGVAKGTFYFYFPRKEDLLVELGLANLDPLAASLDEWLSAGLTAKELLDRTVDGLADRHLRLPPHLLRRIVETTLASIDRFPLLAEDHTTFTAMFRSIFERAVEAGELPAETHVEDLAATLSWSSLQAILSSSLDTLDADLRTVLARRSDLVWAGAASSVAAST